MKFKKRYVLGKMKIELCNSDGNIYWGDYHDSVEIYRARGKAANEYPEYKIILERVEEGKK